MEELNSISTLTTNTRSWSIPPRKETTSQRVKIDQKNICYIELPIFSLFSILLVYTCTALPDLIPSIYLNKGVEEYLYKGAQLMWPGVRNIAEMGPFQNDDLRRIVSHDGTVVGIGAMSCSSEDVDQQNSSEGVCCMVLHHNKDKLYEMGEEKLPQVIWSHEIQKK